MYFSLKYLSKFNVRSEPLYKYKSFENGKYVMEVTVGNEEPVEGMCSKFLLEAEGLAAKAWLAKYQPQAQGSCSSGEKFPKFHLFQSFFYKGRTYERKLSEAPGFEASGSADVPQAQKSSPAGENFQHFVHYKVSSKEVQCDSKRSRPPRKSWQSPKSK